MNAEPGAPFQPQGPIWITLGKGVEAGIESDRLIIRLVGHAGNLIQRIDMGPATKGRINNLCAFLQQLRPHAL